MKFQKLFFQKLFLWMLAGAIPMALYAQTAASGSSTTTPDFSGVYYPLNPFGRAGGGRAGVASTRSAAGAAAATYSVGAAL